MEYLIFTATRGLASRFRLLTWSLLGMKLGKYNRVEGRCRVRRLRQIEMGSRNAISEGAWLWPIDEPHDGIRIRIGSGNYFNRDLMIDACGRVEIGNENMFGPWVYITDSNHRVGEGIAPAALPMDIGTVKIGDRCWIGAKVTILRNVELGDGCVVGAGAVVRNSFGPGSVVVGVPARRVS